MELVRVVSNRVSNRALATAFAVWLAAAASGMGMLFRYAGTPGKAAEAPSRWPQDSGLPLCGNRYTLVMALHPRCSCSRASLEQLSRLLARAGDRVAAHLLMVRPEGLPAGWEKTPLWEAAAEIASARVWSDAGATEATRFGASVSGQVLLYSPSGRLVFSGGITAARGHAGDNAGSDVLLALVKQEHEGGSGGAPVFGCPLRAPHEN